MAYRMYFVVLPMAKDAQGRGVWRNAKDNAECVELVRQTSGAPPTPQWRPGLHVASAKPGEIPPYTAIATFVDGRYPTDDKGRHAALYLGHDAHGIRVVDQWKAQGHAKERVIRFNNPTAKSRSNEGNWYHVIEPA
jgi:hypothetical protein